MTRFSKVLFCVMLSIWAMGAQAQGKIAVLDIQSAILNTDVAQERLKALRNEPDFKDNRKELESLKKQHDKMVEKLKKDLAVLSAEQKQAKSQRISEKRADIEHVARKLQAAEQQLVQEVVQELAPKMQEVVGELIKNEQIGLLLDRKATLHVDNAFNITAKVPDQPNKAR